MIETARVNTVGTEHGTPAARQSGGYKHRRATTLARHWAGRPGHSVLVDGWRFHHDDRAGQRHLRLWGWLFGGYLWLF